MNTKKTAVIWLLFGALVASAGLNVHFARKTAATPEVLVAQNASYISHAESVFPLTDDVCLTDGQMKSICDCCGGTCLKERDDLQQEIRGLVAELGKALNAEPVNEKRVHELTEDIAKVQAQELKSRVHSILQVRKTLTREQLDRLIASVKSP